MSRELISHSPDLKRLQDEGYELEVKSGHAIIYSVPYVNSNRNVKFGTLVSNLTLAGDITTTPDTHVIYFQGDPPCTREGAVIQGIYHSLTDLEIVPGIRVNHMFSNRPIQGGYSDYYEKFTRYIEIITAQAESIELGITAKTFKVIEAAEESVFCYQDTNSGRASITGITKKMENQKIAIVGLGGTGSYILDLIAKTPVAEIHLYDGDVFLQHNAFRSPGAPSIEKLSAKEFKAIFFRGIYQNMHKGITAYPEYLNKDNAEKVLSADFVFISMDSGSEKRELINRLIENNKPFIDSGIGVDLVDDSLRGHVRITLATPQKNDHVYDRISFTDGVKDEYSTNIQIAELNSLNAALAVIKWKKMIGFYHDFNREHQSTYEIDTGDIINED